MLPHRGRHLNYTEPAQQFLDQAPLDLRLACGMATSRNPSVEARSVMWLKPDLLVRWCHDNVTRIKVNVVEQLGQVFKNLLQRSREPLHRGLSEGIWIPCCGASAECPSAGLCRDRAETTSTSKYALADLRLEFGLKPASVRSQDAHNRAGGVANYFVRKVSQTTRAGVLRLPSNKQNIGVPSASHFKKHVSYWTECQANLAPTSRGFLKPVKFEVYRRSNRRIRFLVEIELNSAIGFTGGNRVNRSECRPRRCSRSVAGKAEHPLGSSTEVNTANPVPQVPWDHHLGVLCSQDRAVSTV